MSKSITLFEKAKQLFPGGVNSPVRAFRSVGGNPIFMKKGDGAYLYDVDDHSYIDFCCSWGPLILGHNHPSVKKSILAAVENGTSFGAPTEAENLLADLIISNHKYIEKIRFVSSGTEAVMSAIRLARAATGKNKIIKFEGCYHGHYDALLVKAGSGLVTFGEATSAGIPESWAAETIVLPLNDQNIVSQTIQKMKDEIACIIIEPIPANNGLLIQSQEYLSFLRKICTVNDILLIFDEVISGFRVGFEGASGVYGIQPDIITLGKIIGGGMPVGAYAASHQLMSQISPEGSVYQAGTLSGNPVAMSAGYAALQECLKPDFYENMHLKTEKFIQKIKKHADGRNYPFTISHIGSMFWMIFGTKNEIHDAESIKSESMKYFNELFHILLKSGVYFGPSGYEVGFVSEAHTPEILDIAAEKICVGLDQIFTQQS